MSTSMLPRPSASVTPVAIVGSMFFIMGFFTWINGPLIGFVKLAFRLDDVGAFLVPMAFYLSYFFFALPAAAVFRRTGMKTGMAIGLFVIALGAAVFGQFATMRVYAGALTGLFVIGAGLSLLQTAANPYISIVGPIESAARRIALMGICNKVAGMLAPLLLGSLVLHGMGDLDRRVAAAEPAAREALLDAFAAQIHRPYLLMAGLLALVAVAVLRSPLPDIRADGANAAAGEVVRPSGRHGGSLRSARHLWLGVVCLFVYVGVEVMAGDAIGTYGAGFHLPADETTFYTAFTLGAMLLGYLAGLALTPRFVSQQRYLALSALLGIVLSLGAYVTHGRVSVAFVASLGVANAMMWPAIFPLAIRGLGSDTERGAAFLIMGIAGGAIIPQAFAQLKQAHDFQAVFVGLMVPCYLYIAHYGWAGYRIGRTAGDQDAASHRVGAGALSR